MKVLVLGSKGRLGGALARMWAPDYEVRGLARPELDVADPSALGKLLKPESYDLLVNCTGLTNVDRCERDREEAEVVNARAPGVMAQDAAAKGSRFIHFSTDYVFDGAKTTPYTEDDEAHPLSHYGRTKLEGERAALAPSARHMAVRVAWVFGPDKPSFVDQIIERALANDHVEAIANKTSCMTFTEDVSRWLRPFLDGDLPGGDLPHVQHGRMFVARIRPVRVRLRRARRTAAQGAQGGADLALRPQGVRCAASAPHRGEHGQVHRGDRDGAAALAGSSGGISGEEVDPPTLKLRRTGWLRVHGFHRLAPISPRGEARERLAKIQQWSASAKTWRKNNEKLLTPK